jgi:hypothetical protein
LQKRQIKARKKENKIEIKGNFIGEKGYKVDEVY